MDTDVIEYQGYRLQQCLRLLDLPLELIILIIRNLEWRVILKCCTVCKLFHDIYKTSTEIQYCVELGVDGMIDGPPGGLSSLERLQLLRDRRMSWRLLQWKQKAIIPMPGPCQAYEFVGGVFAKSMPITNLVPGSRHLILSWLPSRTEVGRYVVRRDLGIPTRDFAIDPTQDLIALIEHDDGPSMTSPQARVHVHLRTMSTNQAHPETSCPVFRHITPFRIGNAFIQIVDDVIGLFFWAEGPGLLIWSWKDGRVLVYTTEPEMSPSTWDFAFLSNRAYILTYTGSPGAIEIFTFTRPPEPALTTGPVLSSKSRLFQIYTPRRDPTSPVHVALLQLPPLQPTVPLMNFSTHTGPYLARVPANKPFMTSAESRIHVMTLQYHLENRLMRYILYVHNKSLLAYVSRKEKAVEQGIREKMILSWEEWGPQNTRFVANHAQFHWLRYVHGERVVCPPGRFPVPDASLQIIKIMDFNVHPRRYGETASPLPASAESDDLVEANLVVEPSLVMCKDVFKSPVETRLPYWIVMRTGRTTFSGFMIDDERLVGLKSTAFSEGDMGEINVFSF